MPTKLKLTAVEKSTFAITSEFTDEESEPVVPNEITWTLKDSLGNIVNEREDVDVTPSESVVIVLSGDDLSKIGSNIVTVIGTYNSSLGNNLPIRDEVEFDVLNLKNV